MKNEPRPSSNPSQSEMTSSPTYVVALLCLGSLGDCLPLCALAASLPSHLNHYHSVDDITINEDDTDCRDGIGNIGTTAAAAAARCVIVTHRCHCDLLRGLMTEVYDVAEPPELHPVDLPILFSHGQRGDPSTSSGGGSGGENIQGDAEEDGVSIELDVCFNALRGIRPKALIFNLFSSFGYHLADALKIPCASVSPGMTPSFAGGVALRRLLPPAMLERLDQEGAGEEDKISKGDLELWMLPLFLPRYRRWRLRHSLPPIPCWPILPPASPAMFGVSPTVLPRPGYWPPKADVCGFLSFQELSRRYRAPERLERFMERCDNAQRPVFCVGLGSMPSLGLVQDWFRVVSMAASCLLQAGAGVILLPHGASFHLERDTSRYGYTAAVDKPVVKMEGTTSGSPEARKRRRGEPTVVDGEPDPGERHRQKVFEKEARHASHVQHEFLLDLEGSIFVPHCWLLPSCRGIVHHGGSGTTGAALSAGVVQVVIPCAFDQFFFADQVEHMGVGVRVPGTTPSRRTGGQQTSGVTREGLQSAVNAVLRQEFRESAERYRALLAEEDGVRNACEAIVTGLKMDLGFS